MESVVISSHVPLSLPPLSRSASLPLLLLLLLRPVLSLLVIRWFRPAPLALPRPLCVASLAG